MQAQQRAVPHDNRCERSRFLLTDGPSPATLEGSTPRVVSEEPSLSSLLWFAPPIPSSSSLVSDNQKFHHNIFHFNSDPGTTNVFIGPENYKRFHWLSLGAYYAATVLELCWHCAGIVLVGETTNVLIGPEAPNVFIGCRLGA